MDSAINNPTGAPPMSPLPPHTGLFREVVVALRELLGYWHQPATPIASHGLPADFGPVLPGSTMRDVLLVAIDVDTPQCHEKWVPYQEFQIGISILDTRRIRDRILTPVAENLETTIQSYQFTVGHSKYIKKASKRFRFGKSEPTQLVYFKSILEGLVRGRHMVLVFHGGSPTDLKFLQSLQLDHQPLCILDTVKAAQHPLHLSYRYSLEKLLETFSIPFANLHTAGNDANFCLRALLMIAVKDAENQLGGARDDAWIRTMIGIAQAPLPPEKEAELRPDEIRHLEKLEEKQRRKAKRAEKIERRRLQREMTTLEPQSSVGVELGQTELDSNNEQGH